MCLKKIIKDGVSNNIAAISGIKGWAICYVHSAHDEQQPDSTPLIERNRRDDWNMIAAVHDFGY
jgi:hypothetical protein